MANTKNNTNDKQSHFSAATREKLRRLKSWRFHTFNWLSDSGISYHVCRFCRRGHPDVRGLWKYSVRHYACDDCRNAALAKAEGRKVSA